MACNPHSIQRTSKKRSKFICFAGTAIVLTQREGGRGRKPRPTRDYHRNWGHLPSGPGDERIRLTHEGCSVDHRSCWVDGTNHNGLSVLGIIAFRWGYQPRSASSNQPYSPKTGSWLVGSRVAAAVALTATVTASLRRQCLLRYLQPLVEPVRSTNV